MAPIRRRPLAFAVDRGMIAPASRFDAEVAVLATRLASDAPVQRPLVVYGSSTVRLWQDPRGDLGRDDVLAVGFGGAKLADLAHHYDRLVLPLAPSALVIAAGANDLDSPSVTAPDVASRMRSLVETARAHTPELIVLALTLKPSPQLDAQIDRIRAANAALRHGLAGIRVHLIDTCTPFLLAGGRADPLYYADDGRHMNAAGYALWSSCLSQALSMHALQS